MGFVGDVGVLVWRHWRTQFYEGAHLTWLLHINTFVCRLQNLGTSSVTYTVGMFADSCKKLLASGKFVHVYVTPEGRPVPIPQDTKELLQSIALPSATPAQ